MQPTWIVFDATGTLLHPKPSAPDVYRAVASRYGLEMERATLQERFLDAVRRHFGAATASLTRPTTSEANEHARWRRIVSDTLIELDPTHHDPVFDRLWHHFAGVDAWAIFPDVPDALAQLRDENVRLAIASNYDSRLNRVVAQSAALKPIERVYTSASVGFAKPDGRFYAAIARDLQTAPEALLMVGDDPLNDVQGATAAGWHALLIDRNGKHPEQRHAIADLRTLNRQWLSDFRRSH